MTANPLAPSKDTGGRTRTLVFPCGAENALEIHQALRYSLHVELFGASSVQDFGRFRFERYYGGLPRIQDADFDRRFGDLVAELRIDIVFASHDSVQDYLAPRAAAMRFYLVNGNPRTAAITRRKSATYEAFANCPWAATVFPTPDRITEWPVIVKPDIGQGGQGIALAQNRQQAEWAVATIVDPVYVEYLPGQEITVDCFTDRRRELLWVGPRTRERVRAGITMRSTLLPPTPEIQGIAEQINQRLNLRGPWFFQLKQDRQGQWKLLEISSRVGGAMVAQRARGINLPPLMAVHDYLGRDVTTLPLPQINLVERNISTRARVDFEYDAVFVDLDDTLICDGHANTVVLAFLYQSLRERKRLVLLTRHARDVAATLAEARIAASLFDEIVHLQPGASKADYVTNRAIFIDNHFPERLEVARRKGVPVFDVDAVEFLLR